MTITGFDAVHIRNLAKYTTATAINHTKTFSGAVGEGLSFAAFGGGIWVIQNRKNLKGAWQALGAAQDANRAIMQNATAGGKTFKSVWQGASDIAAKAELETIAAGKNASAAKAVAEAALESGTGYAEALKGINESKSFWGKLGAKAKVGGAGVMAAFEFGIGVFKDVIPTFKQLGAGKGFKQLGKTTVKAAATGVGWWAGSAIGAKAGAAIGTCIGGPIGTAVGAAVGFICGAVGSWLCNKAADAVLGPNEIEKAKQEATTQATDQIAKTGEGIDELANEAFEKLVINYIQNGNKLDKESEQAKKDLEALAGKEIDMDAAAAAYIQELQAREQAKTEQKKEDSPQGVQTQTQVQEQAEQATSQGITGGTQLVTPTVQNTVVEDTDESEEEAQKQKEKAPQEESLAQILDSLIVQSTTSNMMSSQMPFMTATMNPYYNKMVMQNPQMFGFA